MKEELEQVIKATVNEILMTMQDKMGKETAIRAKSMEIAAIILGETKHNHGPETVDKIFTDYFPLANRIRRYISGSFGDRFREHIADNQSS
jgi:hypothetical protein